MQIHVHVGVHKTATTFMQQRLHRSHGRLTRNNIGYMPLAPFRAAFTNRLAHIDPAEVDIQQYARHCFHNGREREIQRLVLSDESLGGYLGRLVNGRAPYVDAAERLGLLRACLPDDAEITLFCSVRAYASFFPSAYSELMRYRKRYVPFGNFMNRAEAAQLSWPSTIQGFIDGLRPHRTLIWRYEDFRNQADQILRELAFGVELPEKEARPGERPSLSHMAIEVLDLVAAHKGRDVADRLIETVAQSLPKSEGFEQFDPWTPSQRIELEQRYAEDCAAIDAALWFTPDGEDQARTADVESRRLSTPRAAGPRLLRPVPPAV